MFHYLFHHLRICNFTGCFLIVQVLCLVLQISFDAVKEFVDSQGITQTQNVPRRLIMLEPTVQSHTINELSPFTTYNVNVSAIPSDHQYRPPTKITVTTQMAGQSFLSSIYHLMLDWKVACEMEWFSYFVLYSLSISW